MKVTELMQKDIVLTPRGIERVRAIYDDAILTEDGEYEGEEFSEDEINPIHLAPAPEILEKNGWVKNGRYNDYIIRDENDCFIGYNTDTRHVKISVADYGKCYEIYSFIEYVHELQRALRSCELKELANNFNV